MARRNANSRPLPCRREPISRRRAWTVRHQGMGDSGIRAIAPGLEPPGANGPCRETSELVEGSLSEARVRSSDITADVRAFFTTYCTAFIRLDAPAIARHFADQIFVASETGKSVRVQIEDSDEWRKTIDHLLEMYRAINFGSAEATAMSVHAVSSRFGR